MLPAVLNKRLLPQRLGELGGAVCAGPRLAEVAVFLQEELREKKCERCSSEHVLDWERGEKEMRWRTVPQTQNAHLVSS